LKIFLDGTRNAPNNDWATCRTVDHALFLLSNPALERVEILSIACDFADEGVRDLVGWMAAELKRQPSSVPKVLVHAGDVDGRARLQQAIQLQLQGS
jgi:hypothetical protein